MSFSGLKKNWPYFFLILVSVGLFFIVQTIQQEQPTDFFKIAFLDIGQGDAIYIESPTHAQLLIDGGPPHNLLPELSKVMPWYDRTIDTILMTNPDTDHYAGFIDLFDRYKIQNEIHPGTKTETETHKVFEKKLEEFKITKNVAERGMVIHLGQGTELTILYPDHDVSNYTTNNGSIIAKLTFGATSVMFTGDAPNPIQDFVVDVNGTSTVQSTLLKVGHHGSRTSASEKFFEAVHPEHAIISACLKNSYGHPHKETTELLEKLDIPSLVTFNEGTIIFHCYKTRCVRQ